MKSMFSIIFGIILLLQTPVLSFPELFAPFDYDDDWNVHNAEMKRMELKPDETKIDEFNIPPVPELKFFSDIERDIAVPLKTAIALPRKLGKGIDGAFPERLENDRFLKQFPTYSENAGHVSRFEDVTKTTTVANEVQSLKANSTKPLPLLKHDNSSSMASDFERNSEESKVSFTGKITPLFISFHIKRFFASKSEGTNTSNTHLLPGENADKFKNSENLTSLKVSPRLIFFPWKKAENTTQPLKRNQDHVKNNSLHTSIETHFLPEKLSQLLTLSKNMTQNAGIGKLFWTKIQFSVDSAGKEGKFKASNLHRLGNATSSLALKPATSGNGTTIRTWTTIRICGILWPPSLSDFAVLLLFMALVALLTFTCNMSSYVTQSNDKPYGILKVRYSTDTPRRVIKAKKTALCPAKSLKYPQPACLQICPEPSNVIIDNLPYVQFCQPYPSKEPASVKD